MIVQLHSPEPDVRGLEKIVDGTRKRVVTVNREQLDRLLMDYQIMLNALRSSSSFKVKTGDEK